MKKLLVVVVFLISVSFQKLEEPSDLEQAVLNCVKIVCYHEDGSISSRGSAVAVNSEKIDEKYIVHLLTASHVIDEEKVLTAEMFSKNGKLGIIATRIYSNLEVVKVHESLDLVLLKMTSFEPVFCVNLGKNTELLDKVYSIGNPLGCPVVVTEGIISNYSDWGRHCSAPTISGNSGGMVVYEDGSLAGVTIIVTAMNLGNIQVPITHLHTFIPVEDFRGWLLTELVK